MSIGKSLVNYPLGTQRIRLEVMRAGRNWFRIISHAATSGSDTVLLDLRRVREENVALGWMVLSHL
jgi:hypothetical protein